MITLNCLLFGDIGFAQISVALSPRKIVQTFSPERFRYGTVFSIWSIHGTQKNFRSKFAILSEIIEFENLPLALALPVMQIFKRNYLSLTKCHLRFL